MTLANYGIGSSKQKDPNSAKVLSKSLQIRTRAEVLLKQQLKSHYRINFDKRNEILNLIRDYYSRLPFNLVIWNKYQTKQSIIDSILLLDSKFNPYRAREAFKLIEIMLINLVQLPWHKEFRKIYTYSGQFRLSISEPLIGIDDVLKAAGFNESKECLMHLVLPDDKMPQVDDGESVTGVIFDCLVAQVIFTNIIEVLENCCKSKQFDENFTNLNHYSWIQAYFRERSQHTTERACSNIQELLNNLTNYLSKLDFSAIKSLTHNTRVVNPSNERNATGLVSQASASSSNNDIRGSPKLSAQERTREFLAQQSHEDDNLLTLSSDLLRIPSNSDVGISRIPNSNRYNNNQDSGFAREKQQSSVRASYDEAIKQRTLLNNGYNTHQYHQQALYDHKSSSKPIEAYDSTDYHNNVFDLHRNSSDSINHPSMNEVDTPINNDREPLIPYRRLAQHHNQTQSSKRNSLYDNDFEASGSSGHLIKSSGAGHLGSNRPHHFSEPYFSESSSHPQLSLYTDNPSRGSSVSKYGSSSPHKKYESRDHDNNKLTNGRAFWSCGSCTYNNQVNSDICEICRNRRSSR